MRSVNDKRTSSEVVDSRCSCDQLTTSYVGIFSGTLEQFFAGYSCRCLADVVLVCNCTYLLRPHVWLQSIAMSTFVCVCVCMSVCP